MAGPPWLTEELYLQLDFWLIRFPLAYAVFVMMPLSWFAKNFAEDKAKCAEGRLFIKITSRAGFTLCGDSLR